MKITVYELLGMVKDGKAPKKVKYSGIEYEFNGKDYINEFGVNLLQHLTYAEYIMTHKVEILEDTNEITVEQIRMATDTLNRLKPTIIEAARSLNKAAEAIKNNFNTLKDISKEEKKIPDEININLAYIDKEYLLDKEDVNRKINEIINKHNILVDKVSDYLKIKGDE